MMTNRRTYTERLLRFVCQAAIDDGTTLAIVGDTGTAKTFYLKKICSENNDRYFLSLKKISSPEQLLVKIRDLVQRPDLLEQKITPYKILSACASTIDKKSVTLLVFYDTWTFNLRMLLDVINELRVHVEKKFAIVLVCTNQLRSTFQDLMTNKEGFAQRYLNTISMWQDIPLPTLVDLEMFAHEIGMDPILLPVDIIESRTYADLKHHHLKNTLNKKNTNEKSN